MPGAAFHLTSRTNGHEHWWLEDWLRSAIVNIVGESLRRTDTRLVAFTIMTNHFHFTVRQGTDPLSRFMQPVCRRVALLVRRVHGREGRIFERRFRDTPCADADHLRQAIYYIHRNPVKAGFCSSATDYVWSSACAYLGVRPAPSIDSIAQPPLTPALELFARTAGATAEDMYAGYQEFARWREACDALDEDQAKPPAPVFPWGDIYATRHFRVTPPPEVYIKKPDLRDVVHQGLRELAPDLDLEMLRFRRGPQQLSVIRNAIIIRAISAGHTGVTVARFLNVSETTVSKVANAIYHERWLRNAARNGNSASLEKDVK